jgi:hypothetical protein
LSDSIEIQGQRTSSAHREYLGLCEGTFYPILRRQAVNLKKVKNKDALFAVVTFGKTVLFGSVRLWGISELEERRMGR